MRSTDAQLVAGFLILQFSEFAEYLDNCGIDPLEAEIIIEDIKKESDGTDAIKYQ